ncbi:MAG: DNA-directed RNA polymerase subunit omega [Planctomycetota bacterium]
MSKPTGQRIEDLSNKMGGRFKLTSLIQKRVREYHVTGRAFMPRVKNFHELFELVLDQIEQGEIRLRLPEEAPPTFKEPAQDEEAQHLSEAETETEDADSPEEKTDTTTE